VVDLHLHTTASDGRLTPTELVRRAAARGVRILAVTDHDTTDGIEEATTEAVRHGVVVIPGIEVTSVEGGRDVHMLGYFFDARNERLVRFLTGQRATRITRIAEMAKRLEQLGLPVDVQPILDDARTHHMRSVGRPALARCGLHIDLMAEKHTRRRAQRTGQRAYQSTDRLTEPLHQA